MTVCLSDSQLHLFLQTQLPVGHIEDCVQGHTPYSVTDAILTYASSNLGFAQAQEDDSIKEPSLTVSYESMESPAPHQPCLQPKETFSPELVACSDSDPLEDLQQLCDKDTAVRLVQKNNHLEAVVEDCGPTEASFLLGDSQDDRESLSLAEPTQQRSCRIQTPVEVHSPMGTGFEEVCGVDGVFEEVCSVKEESVGTLDAEEKAVEENADQQESSEDANINNSEPETLNSVAVLDFKDSDARSQDEVVEEVCSVKQVLENRIISEVNGVEHADGTEGHAADVSCTEELKNSKEPDNKSSESESEVETPLASQIHEETADVQSVGGDTEQKDQKRVEEDVDLVGNKDESDEDSHSLPSSNDSIVKVSDDESVCDEAEDSILDANGYVKTSPEEVALWSDVDASSINILDLHMNGCTVEKDGIPTREDEDLEYTAEISDLSKSLDLNSALTAADLTENSDFSILETSCSPGLADS
ncbi:sorting nexin-11 [Morone saxatilis]|uniref:sorting nexin-11 n=1 Tax=Morone saxatilis TaxID=34816 RepID=UPI0015E24F1B|nr:sorting nexin-11 [Morone saxatilis]